MTPPYAGTRTEPTTRRLQMKALHERTQNLQAESVAADLAARIAGIFEQYPILCGFSVQERSTLTKERAIVQLQGELCLADVSVSTWPGFRATPEFYDRNPRTPSRLRT